MKQHGKFNIGDFVKYIMFVFMADRKAQKDISADFIKVTEFAEFMIAQNDEIVDFFNRHQN